MMRRLAVGLGLAMLVSAASAAEFRLLEIGGTVVRWRAPAEGEAIRLTYALTRSEVTTAGATNCGRIGDVHDVADHSGLSDADVERAAAAAFARWSEVANFRFERVADVSAAQIVFGALVEPTGRAFTEIVLEHTSASTTGDIARALICLNPQTRWKMGFDGNLDVYDLTHTLTHEIGHALGLDHPDARGHVMSFRYQETLPGLTRGDIEGLATLYGDRSPARAEANVPESSISEFQKPFEITAQAGINGGDMQRSPN